MQVFHPEAKGFSGERGKNEASACTLRTGLKMSVSSLCHTWKGKKTTLTPVCQDQTPAVPWAYATSRQMTGFLLIIIKAEKSMSIMRISSSQTLYFCSFLRSQIRPLVKILKYLSLHFLNDGRCPAVSLFPSLVASA